MNTWERDEEKEWAVNPDFWKNDAIEKPKVITEIIEISVGVRPMAKPSLIERSDNIQVLNRDTLKLVNIVADKQLATTAEGEIFQYSKTRNLWIKIQKNKETGSKEKHI